MRQAESVYEAKDSNAQRILFIGQLFVCVRGVSAAEQPSGGQRRVQISHSHFSSVLCRFPSVGQAGFLPWYKAKVNFQQVRTVFHGFTAVYGSAVSALNRYN